MNRPGTYPDIEDIAIGWVMREHEGLTPGEEADLARWLADDQAHADAYALAADTWATFDEAALEPEIVPLRTQALENWQRENRRRWQRRSSPRAWWSLAAALALAVAMGLALWLMPETYATAVGERRVVTLADGSRLTLDGDTAVSVRYSGHAREIALNHGRATFVVAKDPLRPFSVTSAHNLVVATGTEFSVERLSGQTRVILYEGHVVVLRNEAGGIGGKAMQLVAQGRTRAGADQVLTPGRELVVPDRAELGAIATLPDPGAERAWEQGQIDLNAEPLALAAERINRFARGPRLVVMPDAAAVPISGVFNSGDIDSFVDGVSHVFPVDAATRGETIVLSRRKK